MSFNPSQVVPMNKPFLVRRNTSGIDEIQVNDTTSTSNTDPLSPTTTRDSLSVSVTVPTVDQETANNKINLPTPTHHKRKQSDALGVLPELDISQAELSSTFARYSSLLPIEQGMAADLHEEDDNGCYDTRIGSGSLSWKNSLSSPLFSSCQLVAVFVILAVMTTLHSVRSRSGNNDLVDIIDDSLYDSGYEEIGEPMEAHAPVEDWIEFYGSPDRMPAMKSSGPWPVDGNVGGLYKFENVCVTNNIDAPKPPGLDTTSRGLLYFTNQKSMAKNPKRCVPCSKPAMDSRIEDRWDATSDSDSDLGHRCGMKGLHAMFASSVEDYNDCMADSENHKTMIRARQNQSTTHAKQIRYFEEPTLLLQFDAHDREHSLFDTLLTYLPHWHKWRSDYKGVPFQSVISHSVEGCLKHSRNWFCELTHQIQAFGYARELQWERKDTTLYCYKSLYYNQLEYQRDLNHEGLVTKAVMDDFRDELFRNFALTAPRDMSEVWKKDAQLGMKRPLNIALYANGENGWKDLDKLISSTRSMKKYQGVQFNLIDNFDDLTVAEQATAFNLADAVVMATGRHESDHFANVIFSPDESFFAEVGCSSHSLTGNRHFMALLLGTHRSVTKCAEQHAGEEICVSCSSEGSFSMTGIAFQALIDDIMKLQEQKIKFQRDSL
mmetsp:Transcript_4966/g.9720  ORF Transcript_4966/g.9720 Transcript_4966/m.9720 type:complete len:662 (-) Transcript_4966:135-2120(-)|eukprot:CAMPEP_0196156794 /NCGR_PEP_ID=MMETSP0910-20130528/42895_1 /TAXON_ID=49265 /ORGANISM="Thalassiosira rotula, Strain GSO102" /LENGTH=661 /DNA_ID=CAMNT_0041421331 /DNA_START=228 /DNA_END=2213 /DNA_ORIENTATION=+